MGQGCTDESFEELFLAHYGRIVQALGRLLGDWARAEDLAPRDTARLGN